MIEAVGDRDESARRRRRERHAAAVIRAVSGRLDAELRGGQLRTADRSLSMATPFRPADILGGPRGRGVADGLALLLRHCDLDLHAGLRPAAPLDRIVFDVLEQLRCESLTPPSLQGLRRNLDDAFDAWDEKVRADRIDESRSAMLVYTVIHMARPRLVGHRPPRYVDEMIETTRGHLGPIIGHALRELGPNRSSQIAYARPALEIARLVGEVVDDTTQRRDEADLSKRFRLAVPGEWEREDHTRNDGIASVPTAGTGAGTGSLVGLGDYGVFTRSYDRVIAGHDLAPAARLRVLRGELDRLGSAQAVSAPGLARRMLALFGSPTDDDWDFGVDHGSLDGRRLAQLVANSTQREIFRRRRLRTTAHTAVVFLVDNSGSMKLQRYEAIAVLLDTFSRALDLAGVTNEVLGFTTAAWSGGRALADWRAAGSPAEPGRLNELLHVVYKDAATPWRRARPSLAAMLTVHHFREGVDGEAIAWAHARLLARPEPRRILVVVSDGAPNDSATSNANRVGFLDDHLCAVTDAIERRQRTGVADAVELAAIGVDLDIGTAYRSVVDLDLDGTLGLSHYRALETLYGPVR